MRVARPLARAARALFDGAFALALALVLAAGAFPATALAYIDPSVMTYTIQALAGVVVALSAVLGVAWRRGRCALARLLDIDPDGRLVREGEVHRVQPGEAPAAPVLALPGEPGGEAPAAPAKRPFLDRRPYRPPWRTRLLYGCIVAALPVVTVLLAAPLEVVQGAADSLVYGVGDVAWLLGLGAVALWLAVALVLSALRGAAFCVGLAVTFSLGLCAYLQALLLNGGLPAADGAAIHWGDYMGQQVAGGVIWGLIIIGCILYGLHNRRRGQGLAALASACLVAVQAVGLALLLLWSPASSQQGYAAEAPRAVMTEDQLYTVNAHENVIVFVLDTFDDAYLRRIMEADPHLLDEFTGFTDYENCTGSLIPTRFAVPQMLTGEMPGFDEPFSTYKIDRYARSSFLDDIGAAGYSVGVYTDSLTIGSLPPAQQARIAAKTVNMHSLGLTTANAWETLLSLYQMALYRDAPWCLKWAFWYYTDQMNAAYANHGEDAPPEESIYVIDDLRYYHRLERFGLTVEQGNQGAFRFIHLLGSHYPFSYDENLQDVGDGNSDVFRQTRGALKIVGEYLRQLKGLGLYDGATIIVTADHGYWTITEEPIQDTSTPAMFVKPSQTAQEAAAPFRFDPKPVSQLDLQATILDAMGLDWSAYAQREEFPGYSMLGPIPEDRVRRYLTTDSEPDLSETQLREYEIRGNALDFDNWRETGRTIDARS